MAEHRCELLAAGPARFCLKPSATDEVRKFSSLCRRAEDKDAVRVCITSLYSADGTEATKWDSAAAVQRVRAMARADC